jgi:hypothetical protein
MPILQLLEVTCEGPRCKRGKDEKPMRVQWDPEKAKSDPFAIPEEFWSFRTVTLPNGTALTFCCIRCNHDFDIKNPRPLRSPREIAAIQKAEQEVQAKRLAEEAKKALPTNKVDGFGTPVVTAPPATEAEAS